MTALENSVHLLLSRLNTCIAKIGLNRAAIASYESNSFYTDKDVYALANISELFYQQHEDNKEVYDAICEAEQNLKDAAEERETQGVWKTVAGVGLLVVGGVCIVASWGAATPVVAAAEGIVGTGTTIFAFAASAMIPIGQAASAGNLTFRSGATIVAKEGIATAAGAGAQKYTTDLTGNQAAGMIAGMAASMATAQGLNGIEAGVKKLAKPKLGKNTAFMNDMEDILEKHGLTVDEFNNLRLRDASTLSETEKSTLKAIRESVPMPDSKTIMQKVIPADDIQKYLDGKYTQVGGDVTRAVDVSKLKNYNDFYNGLRLDYPGSVYNPMSDKSIGVIRYTTSEASDITIPYGMEMGGTITDSSPFTGNGFTKAMNGEIIPEFKCNGYLDIDDGAQLIEISKDGTETLRAVYSIVDKMFIPVE